VAPLAALVIVLYLLLAPWGANTMDGGLILAQTFRILHGQVPHLDFLTPRPAGSAFLHLIDFALPLPLVLASRLVAIGEFVGSALLFGLLIYRRGLVQLGPAEVLGIAAATLVSIQTFLLIPFYTVDALVLLGGAWLLIEHGCARNSRRALLAGFLLLGIAAMTKQSFWFAPVFALGRVAVPALRAQRLRRQLPLLGELVGAAALPGALYAGWVVGSGGARPMLSQLFGAQAVYGTALFTAFSAEPATTLSLLFVLALLAVGILLVPRFDQPFADLALRASFSGLVVWAALRSRFTDQQWSRQLFWVVVVVGVIRSVAWRRVDMPALLLVFTGWMVALSWGAPTPALLGGPLALYSVDFAWRGARVPRLSPGSTAAAAALAATVGFVAVGAVFWSARIEHRKVGQGIPLGGLDADLHGINASTSAATLFRDAHMCAERYPARYTAVLGEGALLSPVFGFRSPVPIDWFWRDDYRGHEQWLLDKTSAFDARGHYLVLFQTAPQGLEQSAVHGRIGEFFSDPGMASAVAERLHGTTHACGSLVAVYRPGA
jgi:hypothetical protein